MALDKLHSQEIAQEQFLLRQMLGGRYRHIDEDMREESIDDALLFFLAHPQCFDMSRGDSLDCCLEWRARGYLGARLRGEQRHRQHQTAAGVSDKIFEKIMSEEGVGRRNYIGRERNEREAEEREERLESQRAILKVLMARLKPHDLDGVQLLLAGASSEEWMRHLGIEQLPPKQQQKKVNREKERLIRKLKRWAQDMQRGGAPSRVRVRVGATRFNTDGERELWLMQRKMPYIQQRDCSTERTHCNASCSLLSACCFS